MDTGRVWCRVRVVDDRGRTATTWTASGGEAPGLGLVDRLARLHLVARRQGWSITLTEVSPDLAALLDLAGLSVLLGDGLPDCAP